MKFVGTGVVADMRDYSNEVWLLQLRPDSSYERTVPGGFNESGSYSISTRNESRVLDTIISFRRPNNREDKQLLSLRGREMYLNGMGGIQTYQKQ
jgi:hypothetical protein